MAKVNMTTRWVQGIEPPEKGQVDHFDTKPGNLILRVTFRGVKSWCVMYRHALTMADRSDVLRLVRGDR